MAMPFQTTFPTEIASPQVTVLGSESMAALRDGSSTQQVAALGNIPNHLPLHTAPSAL